MSGGGEGGERGDDNDGIITPVDTYERGDGPNKSRRAAFVCGTRIYLRTRRLVCRHAVGTCRADNLPRPHEDGDGGRVLVMPCRLINNITDALAADCRGHPRRT